MVMPSSKKSNIYKMIKLYPTLSTRTNHNGFIITFSKMVKLFGINITWSNKKPLEKSLILMIGLVMKRTKEILMAMRDKSTKFSI